MTNKIKLIKLLMSYIIFFTAYAATAESLPFYADSLKQIEDKYYGQHFLLVLWEESCLPCHEEMKILGNVIQSYPDFNLVMLGTDHIDNEKQLGELLKKNRLENIDSWLFAENNIEKLRYSIDPEWYGELPRNYFYDVDSSRLGHSGKLTEEILLEWLRLHNII